MSAEDTTGAGSESTASAKTANSVERALRQRIDTFVAGWRSGLAEGWDAARASVLHEELEGIAAAADAQNLTELAEPAMELTVFLCSFVESSAMPSPVQRQSLDAMIERLGGMVAKPVAKGSRRAAPVASVRGVVHYLRPPGREIEALPPFLGSQRFLVRPFEDPDGVVMAFSEGTPDLLLVDDAFVPQLHAVLDAATRAREAQREPPLCVVLSEVDEVARVLFAQRAGADAVISSRDPVAILARIEEALEQRRSLGYRVLVVEDDPWQAKFCESILHHRGISTQVVGDAAGVVSAVQSFHPDLVLLDFYLPDGNGIEVAQAIRAEPGYAFLPVVFLSGEQDLDKRFDAISMGGDDFLTKPVKPRHLLMTVESRVRRARALGHSQATSRGERRGILSGRDSFLQELERTPNVSPETCAALVYLAVDNVDAIRDRIGFVAGSTLAQQLAAALAAEVPVARPLCAYGEFAFLGIAREVDELALRDALQKARERLAARTWLSAEEGLKLGFTLVAQRIATTSKPDALIRRVRQLGITAQAAGGNRSEFDLRDPAAASEDPRVRLVRAVLRGPADARTTVLDFQPLVPLAGQLTGQYVVRLRLQPPKSSQPISIEAAEYLPIARDQGLLGALDRRLARSALAQLRAAAVPADQLRLYLSLSAESLLDAAFAPWLAAELRAHSVAPNALALEFHSADLIEHQPGDASIEALQRVGARLCLHVDDDSEGTQHWLSHAAFGLVRFARPVPPPDGTLKGSPWSLVANRFAGAKALGKTVVAEGVVDMLDISELLRSGAHYAHGIALCDWMTDFNFDFAHAVL
ncbi:MAG: response regulator [Tahibacter sp.]